MSGSEPPVERGSGGRDLVGVLIDRRYAVVRELGSGGMGKVYLAVDRR